MVCPTKRETNTPFCSSNNKPPFTEPTPNRGQRLLADYAEVRRRKSKGQRGFGG